jgi:hypothetical protein
LESITWTLLMQTLSQEMIAWTGKVASRRRGGRRRRGPSMAAARVLRWCRVVKKILCYSSMYYFWGTLFLSHVPCQCRDAYNWPRVWRCWRVGEHSDETWAPGQFSLISYWSTCFFHVYVEIFPICLGSSIYLVGYEKSTFSIQLLASPLHINI